MKNACPFYNVLKVLNIYLLKICKIEPPDLLFLFIFIRFYISWYIIFDKFLELHSILSAKKVFIKYFLFLTDSLKPPRPRPPSTPSAKCDESFFVDAPSLVQFCLAFIFLAKYLATDCVVSVNYACFAYREIDTAEKTKFFCFCVVVAC